MKITTFFLFLLLFQLHAEVTHSQNMKLSVQMNNVTVEEAIDYLEKETAFKFVFTNKAVDTSRRVNLNLSDGQLTDVLNQLVQNSGLGYQIIDRLIVLSEKSQLSLQNEKRQIRGTITDEKGEAIIGANIVEKGTTNGVTTNMDGEFSMLASIDGVLQFSYIGYITQEVAIGNKQTFKIILIEDSQSLDEVVVVGYGTQKKANLTGAVATINSEVLEDRPITNLGAGLQGTIANLNISSNNGTPGEGSIFNIRGTTNLSGGSPLVLVDGIEMDPNLINPQDVKDVTVLKDAASAAIYGARAAFGVVLITTKSGFVTQKPIVSFSANYSINKPTVHPVYMNSVEYAQWMNDANTTTNGSNYFDEITMQHINAYYNDPENNSSVFHHPDDASNTYRYSGNTDWYKTLNKTTYPTQQYNVSVQGGNQDFKYFTSAGFFRQDGISRWADEDYKRYNILQNVSYKATDWIEIGLKTTLSIIEQKTGGINNGGSSSLGSILAPDSRPTMPLYHPDGNFAGYCGDGYFTNTAAWQSLGGNSTHRKNDIWVTGNVKLTPFEGLTVNMDYTYNYYNNTDKHFTREYWDYDAGGPAVIFPHTSPNKVSYDKNESKYDVFNIYGEYEKKFGGKHYLKAMVGFNQESKNIKGVGLSRNKLISNEIPYVSMAYGERSTSDYEQEWRIRGTFFRLNYIYDDKYLLEVNGRYDGSSRFPKDERFAFFPSVSLGWRISNEHFWDPIRPIINDLKLRGSYGSLGNQVIADLINNEYKANYYPYISNYTTSEVNYLFNGEKQMGVFAPGLVSDQLTWETVSQYDLGLDFSLLNNKLSGTFDYYERETKDMLTKSKTLPAIIGTGEPKANAADLKTKGWEASITWRHMLKNQLKYNLTFILSDYQSTITKYDNPTKNLEDYHYVGQKQGEIWGFVTEGLFKTDEEAAAWDQSKIIGYNQQAGDIKFADLDGKPGITKGESTVDDPGDRKIIGNDTPRYNFGLRGNAEWKNFDLTLFFQGVMKRDLIVDRSFYLNHYLSQWQVPQKMNFDYWREDNQDAFFPRARLNAGNAIRENQTRFLQNAAYIRLKQLAIGYTIPEHITQKAKISKLRIYFNADNLWEYSKMPDTFDPEQKTVNAYPFMRSFSFGANLTF